MKRNMLTVVAIALSLVNIVLTSILVFRELPKSKAERDLVAKIASIIDLELESDTVNNAVAISDLEVVPLDNGAMINLKTVQGDDKDHYAVIDKISLYLNKKADDYKELNETVKNYESTISEMVSDGFSQYTKEEVQNNRESIKAAILKKVQERFGTQTIADISFKNLRLQ